MQFMYLHFFQGASLVAQMVKNLPAMQETQVQSLDWEDPLEKEMATHSSVLAWRIPWTEEPGRLVHGVAKSWAQRETELPWGFIVLLWWCQAFLISLDPCSLVWVFVHLKDSFRMCGLISVSRDIHWGLGLHSGSSLGVQGTRCGGMKGFQ